MQVQIGLGPSAPKSKLDRNHAMNLKWRYACAVPMVPPRYPVGVIHETYDQAKLALKQSLSSADPMPSYSQNLTQRSRMLDSFPAHETVT